MAKKIYLDIGVLESASYPESGENVAKIASIHELGYPEKNIPERSFLEMPLTKEKLEELKDFIKNEFKDIDEKDLKKAFERIGLKCQNIVTEAFATGGFGLWEPLKEETIKKKGNDTILVDTALLKNTISYDVGEE
ncbi:hypothetical protein GF396_04535 [Candidatus Pacearchaeota archaeon]|nr:hypothetical protein [Candidatus Pacearchaeota archaeon]